MSADRWLMTFYWLVVAAMGVVVLAIAAAAVSRFAEGRIAEGVHTTVAAAVGGWGCAVFARTGRDMEKLGKP